MSEQDKQWVCRRCGCSNVSVIAKVPSAVRCQACQTHHVYCCGMPAHDLTGREFGAYEIGELSATNDLGEYYYATRLSDGKALMMQVLGPAQCKDDDLAQAFLAETVPARRVKHEKLLSPLDVGEIDGIPFCCWEFVAGETVATLLSREHHMRAEYAKLIGGLIADGLAAIHAQNLAYGVIRPQRVLLCSKAVARLNGFGVESVLWRFERHFIVDGWSPEAPGLYAAPETLERGEITPQSDVYSLGATLFHMICGVPPYPARDVADLLKRHAEEDTPSPRIYEQSVPSALAGIVKKALSRHGEDRYENAQALKTAFDALGMIGEPMRSPDEENGQTPAEEPVASLKSQDDLGGDKAEEAAPEEQPEDSEAAAEREEGADQPDETSPVAPAPVPEYASGEEAAQTDQASQDPGEGASEPRPEPTGEETEKPAETPEAAPGPAAPYIMTTPAPAAGPGEIAPGVPAPPTGTLLPADIPPPPGAAQSPAPGPGGILIPPPPPAGTVPTETAGPAPRFVPPPPPAGGTPFPFVSGQPVSSPYQQGFGPAEEQAFGPDAEQQFEGGGEQQEMEPYPFPGAVDEGYGTSTVEAPSEEEQEELEKAALKRKPRIVLMGLNLLLIIGIVLVFIFWIYPKFIESEKSKIRKEMLTVFPSNILRMQGTDVLRIRDDAQMIYVPAGKFYMGAQGGQDNSPQHEVYLDGYFIDRFEVTNRQYKEFCSRTQHRQPMANDVIINDRDIPRWPPWRDHRFNLPEQPIVAVSWDDAMTYAKWAGGTLPSEAQWEKAGRGLYGGRYPWGNNWDANYCNSQGFQDKRWFTTRVGSFPMGRSPFGCYDMAGNVSEWCYDWYSETAYAQHGADAANPWGPASGSEHVIRGGSWMDEPRNCQIFKRFHNVSDYRDPAVGFRVVVLPARKNP